MKINNVIDSPIEDQLINDYMDIVGASRAALQLIIKSYTACKHVQSKMTCIDYYNCYGLGLFEFRVYTSMHMHACIHIHMLLFISPTE